MVTFLGRCCWPGKRIPQSTDYWSSCNIRGKMRKGEEDDDKGMVSDVESVPSLGGREMLSSIRVEICVCVAAVVVVVLMVAVGVVLLVIVVKVLRELCIGAVEVVGVLHIGTVEVDCT